MIQSYDTLSRKASINDPDMVAWTYTYDANGNLLTQTDNQGSTITFDYDALNRIRVKCWMERKTNRSIGFNLLSSIQHIASRT